MMRKIFITGALAATLAVFAQSQGKVGINTTTPTATLDINIAPENTTTPEGLLVPRVTTARAVAMGTTVTESTMIYITDGTAGAGTGSNIAGKGFYYYDAATSKWVKVGIEAPAFFYAPAMVLPTIEANRPAYVNFENGVFSSNLHSSVYAAQFNLTDPTTTAKSPSATTLPVVAANRLEYFITYYDKDVFTNLSISDEGILSYQVVASPVVTEKTFMNIIFKVK